MHIHLLFSIIFLISITSSYATQDKIDKAREIFSQLSAGKKLDDIEKMSGGASLSGLYRVKSENHNYILRVLDPNRAKKNVTQEIEVSQIMGELNIAPKVYGASIELAAFLMEDIEGATLFKPTLTNQEIIILANKIRGIHEQETKSLVKRETAKDLIERVINIDLRFKLPQEYQSALTKLDTDFEILQEDAKFTLIHPDLNPGNIMRTKDDLKIIDWESVTISHPYLNLAMILLFYSFTDKEKKLFLKTYTQDKYVIDDKELNAAYRVVVYLYALNLLGISFRSIQFSGKKAPLVKDKARLEKQIKERKWNELIKEFSDPNIVYTTSQILLEDSLIKE